jgi:hypothetical protein
MADVLSELPDDVAALLRPHVEASQEMLDAIGVQIAGKRDEAKAARASSGIETTWMECEDAYVGIDAANRHEFAGAGWVKSMSRDGPVTTTQAQGQTTEQRSTVFLRLTSRYVDAGVAKLGEILLPSDDKAFSFSEMPIPEVLKAKEDVSQVLHSGLGNEPLHRAATPGEVPPPGAAPQATPPPPPGAVQPPAGQAPGAAVPAPPGAASPSGAASLAPAGAPPTDTAGALAAAAGGQAAPPPPAPGEAPPAPGAPQVPVTVRDLAMERIELARKQAQAAETRIYDWMTQTQYRAEIRKVIADAARIGVGVLKAPVAKATRVMAVNKAPDGGIDLQIKEQIVPASMWVDPWNVFPDPACGENIHDGDFVFERDFMSARQVRGLKSLPGYIPAQIDRVLKEGPDKCNSLEADQRTGIAQKHKGRYTVWYFYGQLTRDEMQAIDTAVRQDGAPHRQRRRQHRQSTT